MERLHVVIGPPSSDIMGSSLRLSSHVCGTWDIGRYRHPIVSLIVSAVCVCTIASIVLRNTQYLKNREIEHQTQDINGFFHCDHGLY